MTPSSFLRKLTVLLLLAALCGAPWAAAAPRAHPAPPAPHTSGPGLGGLLAAVWSTLTGHWGDNGCSLDPDGRCLGTAVSPLPPAGALDNGCSLDPNGRCLGGR